MKLVRLPKEDPLEKAKYTDTKTNVKKQKKKRN